jgi:hypothetical protein
LILRKSLGSAHADVDTAAQTNGSIEQAYRKGAAVKSKDRCTAAALSGNCQPARITAEHPNVGASPRKGKLLVSQAIVANASIGILQAV